MGDMTLPRTSLLRRQLLALGYEDSRDLDDAARLEVRQEEERMNGFGLGPLVLPEPRPWYRPDLSRIREALGPIGGSGPLAALAAACLTVVLATYQLVWTPEKAGDRLPDAIRIKGATKVWVYYERDGEVGTYTGHTRLRNGDRVRVEVLAGGMVEAVLAVVDKDGRQLSTGDELREGTLKLGPGQRGIFPGSVELVGTDEGERLFVTVCQAEEGSPSLEALYPGAGEKVRVDMLPGSCGIEEIKLR